MPTALIVEDEPEANKLLSMLVQLRGYRTESAFTGGEALNLLDTQRPDVVLLDLMLPDTNGYEVCQTIKTRRETSLIPVVMVTARLASENRLRSYEAGAHEYVAKPYTPDQIFQALESARAWRRDAQKGDGRGEIPLTLTDDAPFTRELSRLRSLLLVHTPLDDHGVDRVSAAVTALLLSARTWCDRENHICTGPIANAAYQVDPDHFRLTVHDHSGWLASPDEASLPHEAFGAASMSMERPDPRTLTLTCGFHEEAS